MPVAAVYTYSRSQGLFAGVRCASCHHEHTGKASLVRHDLSLLCALSSNNVYWRKILIRLSGTLGELTTGLQLPDWFHATQAH